MSVDSTDGSFVGGVMTAWYSLSPPRASVFSSNPTELELPVYPESISVHATITRSWRVWLAELEDLARRGDAAIVQVRALTFDVLGLVIVVVWVAFALLNLFQGDPWVLASLLPWAGIWAIAKLRRAQ